MNTRKYLVIQDLDSLTPLLLFILFILYDVRGFSKHWEYSADKTDIILVFKDKAHCQEWRGLTVELWKLRSFTNGAQGGLLVPEAGAWAQGPSCLPGKPVYISPLSSDF